MAINPNLSSLNEDNSALIKARLSAIIDANSDLFFAVSKDWQLISSTDTSGAVNSIAEPLQQWLLRFVAAEDLDNVNILIRSAYSGGTPVEWQHRKPGSGSRPNWAQVRAIPVKDDLGLILEWLLVSRDISEQKNAEEALNRIRTEFDKQQRLFETVTSGSPDLMYVFDLDYRFTYANNALLNMWGRSWENAIGKGLLENGYEPWHAEMHEREIDDIKKNKKAIRGDVSFPHAVLGERVYDYILTPVFNAAGEVEAVAGTTRDVTDRKKLEKTLESSANDLQAMNEEMTATNEELAASNEELFATNEELLLVNNALIEAQHKIEEGQTAFRLAVSAANFGTWYIHSITREFITDARLKELFGYYADESLSIEQSLLQIPEDFREYVSVKLENAIYKNGEYDVTYPVIGLHDNKLRWLRAMGNLKVDPSGTFSAFTGVVMDITEQYLGTEEINRTNENLRMAIEAAGLGTFIIHPDDRQLITSAKFKEFFGFSADEEVSFEAAINQIHPDFKQEIIDKVQLVIEQNVPYEAEYPIIGFHDGKTRWVRAIGQMQQTEGKNRFTGILHEITEKKLDEIRKNDFIGMVSHELKTPLTSLKGYLQILMMRLKKHGETLDITMIDKASQQVNKMTGMINGFLNISRLESGKINIDSSTFDLALLMKEAEEESHTTIEKHKVVFAPVETTFVNADRDKIGQVINNLISNAVKYSPAGSTINVACITVGNTAQISVKDQGMGIKADDLPKIFDRYYRVEGGHMFSISGFGIGLYLCLEIVHRHHGTIWAESVFGEGSTFHFSLPLAENV